MHRGQALTAVEALEAGVVGDVSSRGGSPRPREAVGEAMGGAAPSNLDRNAHNLDGGVETQAGRGSSCWPDLRTLADFGRTRPAPRLRIVELLAAFRDR
jgi:hypothetical protein